MWRTCWPQDRRIPITYSRKFPGTVNPVITNASMNVYNFWYNTPQSILQAMTQVLVLVNIQDQ